MTFWSEVAGPRVDNMAKKDTIRIIIAIVVVIVLIGLGIGLGPRVVRSLTGGGSGDDDDNKTTDTPNKPPTAILTASTYLAKEQEGILFDGNESYDIDYTGNLSNKGIFLYEWDFNDGTEPFTTINGSVLYSFTDQGVYNVILTVFDEDGDSDSSNVTVKIVPEDLFISTPTTILIGEPIVPGLRIVGNSTEINWTIKKDAKYMEINISISGVYVQGVTSNHVEVVLYNPWEDILRNQTVEVIGSRTVEWTFIPDEIDVQGEYYIFIQCSRGVAGVTVNGRVSYTGI
jgi:PKD repeat protein